MRKHRETGTAYTGDNDKDDRETQTSINKKGQVKKKEKVKKVESKQKKNAETQPSKLKLNVKPCCKT